jgi:hypothetical protein
MNVTDISAFRRWRGEGVWDQVLNSLAESSKLTCHESPFQKNLSKMVLSHEWGCDGKKVGVYKKEHLCYTA